MSRNVQLQITRVSAQIPDSCFFLAGKPADFAMEAKAAGLAARPIPELGDWAIRHGDVIYVEVEAVQTGDIPLLQQVTEVGYDQIGLVVVFFSLEQRTPSDASNVLVRKVEEAGLNAPPTSYLFEYQFEAWGSYKDAHFGRRVEQINRMNTFRIVDTTVNLGSIPYGLLSLMYGPPGAVILFIATLLFCFRTPAPVAWWEYLLLVFGLAAVAASATHLWRRRHTNPIGFGWYSGVKLAAAVLLAWQAVASGVPLLVIGLSYAAAVVGYVFFERAHEWFLKRDLVYAVFDRNSERENPTFQPPRNPPSLGSGQFALWRAFRLPVRASFRTRNLTNVFISHRNSKLGLATSKWVERQLQQASTIRWNVFLDQSALKGGLFWRRQLEYGLAPAGVFVVVLTPEDQYNWVRREFFAACLLYMRFGLPLLVVVEAGRTLRDFLGEQQRNGLTDTPVHQVYGHITTYRIDDVDTATEEDVDRFQKTIKEHLVHGIVLRNEGLFGSVR